MNKSEIQTIIKKGEYGAVLAMKIWQRCLFYIMKIIVCAFMIQN